MKTTAVFFLFLFFHLLGGSHPARAGADSGKAISSVLYHLDKSGHLQTAFGPGKFVVDAAGAAGQNESFFSIEDDNEDEDYARKQTFVARCLHFICAFLSHSSADDRSTAHAALERPFYAAAPRYIVQRTLRI